MYDGIPPRLFKNLRYHAGGGGFSVGARYAYAVGA